MCNCSSITCLEQKTNEQRISDSFSETIEEVKEEAVRKRGEPVGNFECDHNVAPPVAVIVSQRLSRSLTNHRQNSSVTGSHRGKNPREKKTERIKKERRSIGASISIFCSCHRLRTLSVAIVPLGKEKVGLEGSKRKWARRHLIHPRVWWLTSAFTIAMPAV
ncbi:hypothetical protein BHE74_00012505 [Ensete ventricosum]|uniref:Uncharacterized protein n=1 Tax=Ensete ventricosum TaxID=4639 RepID=A0A444G0E6_ENSVE|nr:hypothetical protein GW17_00007184 [Ensete ventricosum]RWW79221.1 hypothetical protein BHE74_00012505 [Ensete ventricosum]RZR70638.1 hypothetical protein BHM03_00000932 [Ensete ventricosum]